MAYKLSDSHPPRGLLRLSFRLPIWLYRFHLGWLLGDRFILLTTIGRKSGKPRQVVVEVVSHHKESGIYVIASGWKEKSDWFLNLQKAPHAEVQSGRRRFAANATRLSIEQADQELYDYAQRHPIAFRELAGFIVGKRLSGSREDCHLLAEEIPLIALQEA
jgi:deazaflavin-dependent oxidoreductase (nitroreductase family)